MNAEQPAQTGFFLTNESDAQQFMLFNGAVIGRAQGDLTLQADPRMSSKHARFTVDEADVFVEDLGSRNGIFVNGNRLESGKPFRVFPGDMIAMGNTTFCLGRLSGTPINPVIAPSPKEDTHTAVVGKSKPGILTQAPPAQAAPVPASLPFANPFAAPPAPLGSLTPKSATETKSFGSFVPETPLALEKPNQPRFKLPGFLDDLNYPMSENLSESLAQLTIFLFSSLMILAYLVLAIMSKNAVLIPQEELISFGANHAPLTTQNQWWRLLSTAFIHSSLLHLFINQLLLWQAGNVINRSAGALSFISVFVVTQVLGGLFALWTQPEVVFVGAAPGVLGCVGAAMACFALDLKAREEFSWGQLTMMMLVLIAANLKTGLQAPIDAGLFAVSFFSGFLLRYALAPATNFDSSALWKQVLRPVGTFAVCAGLIYFAAQQMPVVKDPNEQLTVALEKAIPIAKSYDELKTKLSGNKMKTEDAFRELERDHLPKLRAFEKELQQLPAFNDERKTAVIELRSAVRAWIESLEFQGQAISTLDSSYNDRARQSEDVGYAKLSKAAESFKNWKEKSQTETSDKSRLPSQVDP